MVNIFLNRKVIVTGHTGFKGSWLSIWLHSLGAKVYGISDKIPTTPSHFEAASIASLVTDYRIDIKSFEEINKTICQIEPDFVFHLAAQPLVRYSHENPKLTWEVNTFGTINVLESLRNLSNNCVAIFVTSDKVYDNLEWEWGYREDDKLGGADPYSASKAGAEVAISSYVRSYFPKDGNIRIGIGRAGNVIGGGDWALDRIIPDCVRAWSIGESVALRNPHSTRPWQHVLEPLGGYLTLAKNLFQKDDLHGEAFNFGPNSKFNYSVLALVKSMSKFWDKVKYEDVTEITSGPKESLLLKLNCDKALYHLDWTPILEFNETVKFTIDWYKLYFENSINSEQILKLTKSQIEDYVNLSNKIK
jgi:CDP-glucose 4,6-dehydratase